MNTTDIIRAFFEILAVLLTAYAIYRVDDIDKMLSKNSDNEPEDKPVQFNARDIFWVEEENV